MREVHKVCIHPRAVVDHAFSAECGSASVHLPGKIYVVLQAEVQRIVRRIFGLFLDVGTRRI